MGGHLETCIIPTTDGPGTNPAAAEPNPTVRDSMLYLHKIVCFVLESLIVII